jgi:membrane protease subunit (stomatin/prohibitin family)
MGLMDFIKGELLEIIEWNDDSRDTISWRFPDEDKAIKNGAQLIVRESQTAQFVSTGQFADAFGPGKHTLSTQTSPSSPASRGGNTDLCRRSNATSISSTRGCSPATSGAPATRS